MASLAELKAKYGLGDGAKYEPFCDCTFCNGTGERTTKHGKTAFCICLFVEHAMSQFSGEALGQLARKLSKEIKEPDHVD